MTTKKIKTGIILSGGGARAAYQVGVLKAIFDIIPRDSENPFPIICGSSAGAINATILACYAGQYRIGLRRLESVWSRFHVSRVFRSDYKGMFKQTFRFFWHLISGKKGPRFTSLLDNQPLKELLREAVPFKRLQEMISEDKLHALCITCSDYTDGGSYSFYQGKAEIKDWDRHRRLGRRDNIHLSHLMASSAIPILFPAVAINHQFYGDGSVGFLSPISPALHLGADKVLVIALESPDDDSDYICYDKNQHPSISDVAGHVLDSVFIDSLDSDIERLQRINKTLENIPKDLLSRVDLDLKKVESLVISPSQDLGSLAGKYAKELPAGISFFFKRLGIETDEGSNILSYLLFEKAYCKKLIELGYEDAMAEKTKINHFFRHLY